MPAITWLLVVVTGLLYATSQVQEKNIVILTADPDGKVGQVAVSTKGGQQLLVAANQMTVVSDPAKAPAPTKMATREYIERNFADALSVEPLPPIKFLLYFQPDSTDLDPASAAIIPEILAAIILRESKDIGIHGHSDRVGSAEKNLELSLRRAIAVESLLLENDISPDCLEVASHGEGNPLVPTLDEVAEPRNRRVEVVVR